MNPERRVSGWVAAGVFLVLIAVTSVAAAGLVTDPAGFREDIDSWGAAGLGLVVALAVVHAVVPFPAELLGLATGFALGFGPAFALMVALWTLSSLIAYWIGNRFGRPLVERLVRPEALEPIQARVAGASTGTLLAMRVIPVVPYNLVSYPCGMFGVPLRRFAWTTAVGLTPQVGLVVYAGSRAVDLSPTDLRIWLAGLAWLALILVGRWVAGRLDAAPADEVEDDGLAER